MAFTPYATPPEFRAWVKLNDSIDDAVILDTLGSVTEWIDDYCQRHFWQDGTVASPVARTFIPDDRLCVSIDDLVPGSITTLKTDETGDGTFETTWSASDYQLHPVNRPHGEPITKVEAVATRRFPVWHPSSSTRSNRVELTGIWGWTNVPRVVKQACLIQTNRELKRSGSPEGVAGFGEFGVVRISGRLDPDVERLLDAVWDPSSVGV